MDVLCLMHDSDEYGVLRWPLTDIARAAGVPIKFLRELAKRGVLKGSDKGCDSYTHTPVHARKKGNPITLLEKTDESCWYSSRFLVDEWRRSVSGGDTRFKSPSNSPSGGKVNNVVKESNAPIPSPSARRGEGATSTSTSTSTTEVIKSSKTHTEYISEQDESERAAYPGLVGKAMVNAGIDPTTCNLSHPDFLALIDAGATVLEFTFAARAAVDRGKGFAYAVGTVKGQRQEAAKLKLHKGPMPNKQQQLEDRNRDVADEWKPDEVENG